MRMSVCPGGPTVCPLHLAGGEGAGWGCMEGFDCNYGFFNDEAALGGCDPAFGCLQNIDLTAICPVGANCGSLVQDALSRLWSGILGLPTVPCGGTNFSGPWCNSNPMVNPIMDAHTDPTGSWVGDRNGEPGGCQPGGHCVMWDSASQTWVEDPTAENILALSTDLDVPFMEPCDLSDAVNEFEDDWDTIPFTPDIPYERKINRGVKVWKYAWGCK
jgi:hypothetical protein